MSVPGEEKAGWLLTLTLIFLLDACGLKLVSKLFAMPQEMNVLKGVFLVCIVDFYFMQLLHVLSCLTASESGSPTAFFKWTDKLLSMFSKTTLDCSSEYFSA